MICDSLKSPSSAVKNSDGLLIVFTFIHLFRFLFRSQKTPPHITMRRGVPDFYAALGDFLFWISVWNP